MERLAKLTLRCVEISVVMGTPTIIFKGFIILWIIALILVSVGLAVWLAVLVPDNNTEFVICVIGAVSITAHWFMLLHDYVGHLKRLADEEMVND